MGSMSQRYRCTITATAEQFDNNRFLRDRTLPKGCERRYGVDEEGVKYERRPVFVFGNGCETPLDHGDWIVTDMTGEQRKIADGKFQKLFEPIDT